MMPSSTEISARSVPGAHHSPATTSFVASSSSAQVRFASRKSQPPSPRMRRLMTSSPSIAVSRPRTMGTSSGASWPRSVKSARIPSASSRWMLIMKWFGASVGSDAYHVSSRPVRTPERSRSTVSPKPNAITCATLSARRRAMFASP